VVILGAGSETRGVGVEQTGVLGGFGAPSRRRSWAQQVRPLLIDTTRDEATQNFTWPRWREQIWTFLAGMRMVGLPETRLGGATSMGFLGLAYAAASKRRVFNLSCVSVPASYLQQSRGHAQPSIGLAEHGTTCPPIG
jgi:hypothetical protein